MKSVLAIVGGIVVCMFALGLLEIGHFQLSFTTYPLMCVRKP